MDDEEIFSIHAFVDDQTGEHYVRFAIKDETATFTLEMASKIARDLNDAIMLATAAKAMMQSPPGGQVH